MFYRFSTGGPAAPSPGRQDLGSGLRREPERRTEAEDQPGQGSVRRMPDIRTRRPAVRRRSQAQARHIQSERKFDDVCSCRKLFILYINILHYL